MCVKPQKMHYDSAEIGNKCTMTVQIMLSPSLPMFVDDVGHSIAFVHNQIFVYVRNINTLTDVLISRGAGAMVRVEY